MGALEKETARPVVGPQGSQVCIPDSPRESGLVSKGSKGLREDSTHGHHQMVDTKIRLIIFFAA